MPRLNSASATPRQAGPSRSSKAVDPRVLCDREALDRRSVHGAEIGRGAGGLPGHAGGRVQVVDVAEVILQNHDAADQLGRSGLHRLTNELERIAQPLGRDPELVQGRHIGITDDRIEGPDRAVGFPRDGRRTGADGRPGIGRSGRASALPS